MYPITFTVHNELQLNAVLKALGGNAVAPASDTGKTPTGKPTAAPASSASGAAPQTTDKKADAPAQDGDDKVFTIDDAKKATTDAVKAGKRAEIVALLKEFKVEVAAKLKPEQIAAFCTKAGELVK